MSALQAVILSIASILSAVPPFRLSGRSRAVSVPIVV